MKDEKEQFRKLQEEQARLYDPVRVDRAIQLVPVNVERWLEGTGRKGTKTAKTSGANASLRQSDEATGVLIRPDLLVSRRKWAGHSRADETKAHAVKEATPNSRDHHERAADNSGSQEKAASMRTGQQSGVSITVTPPVVRAQLDFFREHRVTLDAPTDNAVEAVWFVKSDRTLQRAVMDRNGKDKFVAALELPDGNYFLGYEVSGHTRPDGRSAQRILLTRQGVFGFVAIDRRCRLTVTNEGTEPEQIRMTCSASWLSVEPSSFFLAPSESARLLISFDTALMKNGENESSLHLIVRRGEDPAIVVPIRVNVTVNVNGAVPEVSVSPTELGELAQGIDFSDLSVIVRARGNGELKGMINFSKSADIVDFCLEAGTGDNASVKHSFRVDSAFLAKPAPREQEARFRVLVVTDSFIANRRVVRAEIPYKLLYLKKSLPALNFGEVESGASKTLRLDVFCSEKNSVDLNVDIPAACAGYLEAFQARSNAYVFRFNGRGALPGTVINEVVGLFDRNSGLRDRIKVLATITSPLSDAGVLSGASLSGRPSAA